MAGVVGVGAKRALIGRNAELALLACRDAPIVYVHGIAGIGKTALLLAFVAEARVAGAAVVALDCRSIEPTERGFLDAAAAAVGCRPSLRELVDALDTVAPATVALDHYEVLRLMDTWLRHTLVAALPEGVRLVIAGREPPVAGWFSAGANFRSVPLGPLDEKASRSLLAARGLAAADAARVNAIARGHPLALTLAAAGAAEHQGLRLEDAAVTRVVAELARLYLEEVADASTRRALEASAVVRRTTERLLAAMLAVDDAAELVGRLIELPFVHGGRDGVLVHEAVSEAVSAYLRATDPLRHRRYRRAAWRQLRAELADAPAAELWRYTADMLYLIDNPVVREAFFPSGVQPLVVEPARETDANAVAAIARRHEAPAAAAVVERWLAAAPEAFSVVRDRDAIVVGFFSLLETRSIRMSAVQGDPVVEAWARHLRADPVSKGQVVLGLRRWLDAERGELPCASQAACWLDIKRTYMALRPELARIYVVLEDAATYWPVIEKLGFRPLPDGPVQVGGHFYASVVLDFGPRSVDGWLARLAAAELGIDADPPTDPIAREISVRGTVVPLTPLEYGLFAALRLRDGKIASRPELLREVWGTDYTGGSNVVDAVVRSVRRKLGPAATVVETVRGSGYRLRTDWRAQLG